MRFGIEQVTDHLDDLNAKYYWHVQDFEETLPVPITFSYFDGDYVIEFFGMCIYSSADNNALGDGEDYMSFDELDKLIDAAFERLFKWTAAICKKKVVEDE